jgi:hypothetical protein
MGLILGVGILLSLLGAPGARAQLCLVDENCAPGLECP